MTTTPPAGPAPLAAAAPSKPKTCGLAIASLVCAIVGLCTLGLGGLVGIILGALALSKIGKSAGAIGGKGLAIAGLVVGTVSILLIPVIAILVAFLLPAMAGARDMARGVQSISNVRQLCVAANIYATERNEQLPPPDSWPQELEMYLGGKTRADKLLTDPGDEHGGRAYAMNAKLTEQYSHLRAIGQPGRTVLFFECAPGSPPGGGPENLLSKPRHAKGYVIGFVDGHVEAVPPEQVKQLIWDPQAAPLGP